MKTIEVDLEALTAFLIDEDKYTNMDKMTPEYKSAREKIKVIVKESGLPEMEKYALLTTCLAEIAHEYNNTITHTYDQPAPYGETKPSVQVEPKFRKGDKVKIVDEIVKTFGNVATITHCEVDDGKVFYWLNDDIGCYYEYQLGPYTEPETKDAYEQYKEAKAEEYKNQSKDMEEKSQEYAEIAFAKVLKAPWPEAKQAFADAYLAGATEALARQWRSGEEIPNQRLCITKSKDFDNRTEIRFCEWDGENFIDLYDDSVIRPSAFLPIPEPPKDESHV